MLFNFHSTLPSMSALFLSARGCGVKRVGLSQSYLPSGKTYVTSKWHGFSLQKDDLAWAYSTMAGTNDLSAEDVRRLRSLLQQTHTGTAHVCTVNAICFRFLLFSSLVLQFSFTRGSHLQFISRSVQFRMDFECCVQFCICTVARCGNCGWHVVAQPKEQRRPFFNEIVPQLAIWGSLGSHGLTWTMFSQR